MFTKKSKILLENAYNEYKMLDESYDYNYSQYMERYQGDDELVSCLLYPLELKVIDAEQKFYDLYFSLPVGKLDLMRYLYDHVTAEYGLPSDKEVNDY